MGKLYLRDDLDDDTKIIWYTTANKGGPSGESGAFGPAQMTITSVE